MSGIPGFDVVMVPGEPQMPIDIDRVRRLVSDVTDLAAVHYGKVVIAFAKAFMSLAALASAYGADPVEALNDLALRTASGDSEN